MNFYHQYAPGDAVEPQQEAAFKAFDEFFAGLPAERGELTVDDLTQLRAQTGQVHGRLLSLSALPQPAGSEAASLLNEKLALATCWRRR